MKRPEDILPAGVDEIMIAGSLVRKGTIAAFLANIEVLETEGATEQQKSQALQLLKELVPSIIKLGLHKHVIFKNPYIQQMVVDTKGCK